MCWWMARLCRRITTSRCVSEVLEQRIIDLPATLAQGKKVKPWRDDPQFVSHAMVVNSFD